MDVLAKIDRTLLDNELRNLVRFRMSRDSDRALFKPTYKIEIDVCEVIFNSLNKELK